MSVALSAIRWFEALGIGDIASVGGKNASLGEMIRQLHSQGIRVPGGFAVTAEAYRAFLDSNDLPAKIHEQMQRYEAEQATLHETGQTIRKMIQQARFPDELAQAIREAYHQLCERYGEESPDLAVRSSATAEDLPEASFAGQQESYLNVRGETALLDACRNCFASLYTDRAISYRQQHGFGRLQVALSVGVQKMVRSDRASAGVIFTLDTETGFPDMIVIDGAWGLGESVVKGAVDPDEWRVFKPALDEPRYRPILGKRLGSKASQVVYAEDDGQPTRTVETSPQMRGQFCLEDEHVLQLARWAKVIERHYGRPMDIEWARDGLSGELFIVQARPETVESRRLAGELKSYNLKERGPVLVQGPAIGSAIASGKAFVIKHIDEAERFEQGGILITDKTDPDWVPIMKQAAGIVTDHGGRTSHAAIVSRELGVPAIVGTGDATTAIADGQLVTLSCAEGETGLVYEGQLAFEQSLLDLSQVPATRTRIVMNLASPDAGFRWWSLPAEGVGLARMEFIINNIIKIHPLALTRFDQVHDDDARKLIEQLTAGYADKREYFVDHLARGIGMIAASQYPDPVIVRLSDFKTNEYANLIGGGQFEPHEANPMLGFRGASRYYSPRYRDGFALECQALKRAREQLGLMNIIAMVPFCRTPEEADKVLAVMAEEGLRRGEHGFQVYVMAEIPSNITLASEFAQRFDGFSIGSNDLTQLALGVDRDSADLAPLFDERHPAITTLIRQLIQVAHEHGRPVGICGQAPSDHSEFARFLVEAGIDSISVNPDSVLAVRQQVARAEAGG